MDGPGTVTWEEFVENAGKFLAVSDKLSDGWEFRGDKDIPGQAYLVRKTVCFLPDDSIWRNDEAADDNDGDIEEFHARFQEDPHEAPSVAETPFITEHHILWSMSYSVPVLFFNGWKSDYPGVNPVSVNEAQTVHSSKLNYTELSQAIHPIVGTPFLQLHPCLSRELLRGMPDRRNDEVTVPGDRRGVTLRRPTTSIITIPSFSLFPGLAEILAPCVIHETRVEKVRRKERGRDARRRRGEAQVAGKAVEVFNGKRLAFAARAVIETGNRQHTARIITIEWTNRRQTIGNLLAASDGVVAVFV
ncbi:PREDICTED: ubiquitin-like-conjugating enzyme ATG10 isoform X2 [Dinoponera quadriceps]|nr:PREDICTED: ubiquitin-like-conjugating enzyme ATG10 isoform X2 [Dinoponera quadriceps]XP_014474215.1 PREDICTED: ubiquitin-like-conjugating enzyme ATG10 isoform X2 [Dinoponera quadriceps]XP_014474216.1 PREDICTED: ubiquitin-like-conjugating enzyme ATG10 isoform X2 [Dinoponera quadriceps]XP_014474218.1 PREDICTED: ubiquitin-like-conjugating enzyme ATG10 isoform X2 [Dinoponera quadriceps]